MDCKFLDNVRLKIHSTIIWPGSPRIFPGNEVFIPGKIGDFGSGFRVKKKSLAVGISVC